jgi:hypothetical protein
VNRERAVNVHGALCSESRLLHYSSLGVECFGYLLLGCSLISVSFIICMLTLLLIRLAGLHICVG